MCVMVTALYLIFSIFPLRADSGPICEANLNMVGSRTDLTWINQALTETNNQRLNHGVAPLTLSDELNKISQNWANQLANKYRTMVHTQSVQEFKGTKCGENLYFFQSSTMAQVKDGAIPVKAWYSEITNYDFATGKSKNGKMIGHFTQQVWKNSKLFGIGLAISSDGKNFVCATYYPAGNYVGEYRQNVLPGINGVVPPAAPSPPSSPSQPTGPMSPTVPAQPVAPGPPLSPSHRSRIGMCPFGDSDYDATPLATPFSVCELMKPRGGAFPAQTSPCPWRIFIYRNEIEQLHAQPVTLGSLYSDIFSGYLVTARKLNYVNGKEVLGDFIGHFEPQWDAGPVCCNGATIPNMLDGSTLVRVRKPNQTLLWTSPGDYLGPFVFVATFWRSVRTYWFEIRSTTVNVIERKKKPIK